MNRQAAIVNLRLIAAQAEKLADDLEHNRLWPGEYSQGVTVIENAFRDLPEERSRL